MLRNRNIRKVQLEEVQFKKYYSYALLAVFLVFTILFISPKHEIPKLNYRASQLEKVTEETDNTVRTDYYDATGRLTIAADLGYATIVITVTDSGKLEEYFDDKGDPIRRSDGYYAVLREYNAEGKIIRNTYLDADNVPMMTFSGYAIEEREYDDNKQLAAVRYYDTEGNPTCTDNYGYGRKYEYENKRNNNKVTFIDISGAPMITKQGYASVFRKYYITDGPENEKVESEFYYDEKGDPISLTLGQYGVHKEYNDLGQDAVLTYLDAKGKPMVTNKGYTTVIRTFQPNNYVASEKYYDLEGRPFSLSEGQYGFKQENGQTVYLNQDGGEQYNLKNLLYNHSWIIIPLSITVIVLSALIDKKWNVILLALCIITILYFTLMFREAGGTKNISLFRDYLSIIESSEVRADILKNIWLFVPLGAILSQLYPKNTTVFFSIVLSVAIEFIQYITDIGYCEIEDIISNSLGGWIGFSMAKLTKGHVSRIKNRNQKYST